jgi:hypothetical protein
MDSPTPLPWQMTLTEFNQRGAPCPPAIAAEMETARGPLWTLRTEIRTLGQTILIAARRPTDASTLLEHERNLAHALRSPRVSKDLRASYTQKRAELARLSQAFDTTYDPTILHRRIVREALAAGLPVPPDVRADHPELDPIQTVPPAST